MIGAQCDTCMISSDDRTKNEPFSASENPATEVIFKRVVTARAPCGVFFLFGFGSAWDRELSPSSDPRGAIEGINPWRVRAGSECAWLPAPRHFIQHAKKKIPTETWVIRFPRSVAPVSATTTENRNRDQKKKKGRPAVEIVHRICQRGGPWVWRSRQGRSRPGKGELEKARTARPWSASCRGRAPPRKTGCVTVCDPSPLSIFPMRE